MRDVIRDEAQKLMLSMILHADRYHRLRIKGGLMTLLKINNVTKMTDEKAKGKFLQAWTTINWKARDSIRPFVPFFERAYALTPKSHHSGHDRIEALLKQDGFGMKDGRLVQMRRPADSTR